MSEYLQRISDWILSWLLTDGIKIVIGLLLLSIGWKLIKKLVSMVDSILEKKNADKTLRSFLEAFIDIVLKIILIIVVMQYIGIEATGLAALIASAGLAVGLALQGSLSNFAGGVIILLIRPFNVGEYIEGAGYAGTVERIGMFYTTLITPDNKEILIPNGNLANGSVINYSSKPTRRVDMVFGVSYEDDVLKVKKTLNEIISENPLIINEPAPFVAISEHAASSINFVVRVWCNTEDYWTIYFDLLEKVTLKFGEENISIPYPQMDLHLKGSEEISK